MSATKIDVFCPQCRAKLAVPVAALGKSGKCPHCQSVFPLAMPAQRPAAAPASPLTPLSPAPYAAPALAANVLDPLGSPDLMPLSDAGLTPLPAANPYAAQSSNPFAAPAPPDDYTLQPAALSPYAPTTTLPSNASLARERMAIAAASYEETKQRKYYNDDGDGDGWGINAGIGGGALLMLGAVVWFVVGLFFLDFVFFYPPIMFIIGLIAFLKGIFDNFSD